MLRGMNIVSDLGKFFKLKEPQSSLYESVSSMQGLYIDVLFCDGNELHILHDSLGQMPYQSQIYLCPNPCP